MTNSNAKIQGYIMSELQNEIIELERRIAVLETDGTPRPTFLVRKLKEFYWTVTRLSGLGHWHEGQTAEDAALGNGKRNLNLFPGATCERLNGVSFAQPGQRLLIDVTDTISCGFVSGIQRVVRQLAKGAMESGAGIPVIIQDGELCPYLRSSTAPEKIEIVEGDKFIMADASWNDVPACRKAMERTSRRGGSNIVILHDIHALLYPGLFHPDNVRNCVSWFDAIVLKSDALVAVSKSAAEEFLAYVLANEKTVNPKMQVGWQHLGADFEIEIDEAPSPQIMQLCAGGAPFFLSVGTLEPKKGYTIALDAMERLWERGVDARYIIVGRYGWNTHALERRIRSHPEFNKRLFWLGQVSAADLQHLYKNAHSLIVASVAEGFGLPLIEAANFGLPAIVSDIPVFREVGDGVASYFEVADSESLAMRLDEALVRRKASNALPPILKWRQSTDELLKLIKTHAYQFGALASEGGGPTVERSAGAAQARADKADLDAIPIQRHQ
jgi:alpha-1,2-rhamnosyltransferase